MLSHLSLSLILRWMIAATNLGSLKCTSIWRRVSHFLHPLLWFFLLLMIAPYSEDFSHDPLQAMKSSYMACLAPFPWVHTGVTYSEHQTTVESATVAQHTTKQTCKAQTELVLPESLSDLIWRLRPRILCVQERRQSRQQRSRNIHVHAKFKLRSPKQA